MTDQNRNKKSDNFSDVILSKKTQTQADINEVFVDRADGTPKLKTGIGSFFSFVSSAAISALQSTITGVSNTVSGLSTALSTLTGRVDDLENAAPAGPAYKVYSALLTQTGINAPTVSLLENTLPGTPVWAYDSVGNYSATLAGAFITDKTAVIIGKNTTLSSLFITPADIVADVWYTGQDKIYVTCVNGSTAIDGVLTKLYIEIRVYN